MTTSAGDLRALLDRDRVVARLQELVRAASENPPGNEAPAAAVVASMCRSLGLDVSLIEVAEGRPSVIARKRFGDGPTVGYCSHIDVVPAGPAEDWAHGPFEAVVTDGRLHGRGSSDAKGPIAAALEATQLLIDSDVRLAGTLELELVADEETMGFKGAGQLVADGTLKPDVAIVGEPTSLRIVRAQRGASWIRISTSGVAAHGSAPERGVSAIKHMSEIVRRLEETLPDISHPVVGGPSLNIGTIAGGSKVNMVPSYCAIEVDRRTIPGETKEDVIASIESAVDRAKQTFPDIDATIDLEFYAPPFEVNEAAPLVECVTSAVAEARGKPAELMGFRGASDARFFADAGIDVVVCGPGDIAVAHTVRESILLDELADGAVAYALAFARLLAPAA
ncbi:MAG: M20 family metallopeptidase [Actinomycetota bacterium]|nr:M20 family metallopeptidase [Actinomycetota bacterium]